MRKIRIIEQTELGELEHRAFYSNDDILIENGKLLCGNITLCDFFKMHYNTCGDEVVVRFLKRD